MTLTDYIRQDFAAFEEWHAWSRETRASYIDCLISQYRRRS